MTPEEVLSLALGGHLKAISFLSCAVMLCVASVVLAQSEMRKAEGQKADAQESTAQMAFARMKALAGNWKGTAAMGAGPGAMSAPVRVTSGGDALVHEMVPEGRANDPSNGNDDPLTMMYVDGDRLMLTHYCDSGKNRPRMVGTLSPDGKSLEFDFVDLSGATKYGHMNHAVFTIIDADHHTEDWTYMSPENKADHAHIDLVRVK
jgi:hypothetical protein